MAEEPAPKMLRLDPENDQSSPSFDQLPPSDLGNIIKLLDFESFRSLSMTNRFLNGFIKANQGAHEFPKIELDEIHVVGYRNGTIAICVFGKRFHRWIMFRERRYANGVWDWNAFEKLMGGEHVLNRVRQRPLPPFNVRDSLDEEICPASVSIVDGSVQTNVKNFADFYFSKAFFKRLLMEDVPSAYWIYFQYKDNRFGQRIYFEYEKVTVEGHDDEEEKLIEDFRGAKKSTITAKEREEKRNNSNVEVTQFGRIYESAFGHQHPSTARSENFGRWPARDAAQHRLPSMSSVNFKKRLAKYVAEL